MKNSFFLILHLLYYYQNMTHLDCINDKTQKKTIRQ